MVVNIKLFNPIFLSITSQVNYISEDLLPVMITSRCFVHQVLILDYPDLNYLIIEQIRDENNFLTDFKFSFQHTLLLQNFHWERSTNETIPPLHMS